MYQESGSEILTFPVLQAMGFDELNKLYEQEKIWAVIKSDGGKDVTEFYMFRGEKEIGAFIARFDKKRKKIF